MSIFKYFIVFTIMFFLFPVNAAEKPKSIKKQTIAENYLTVKEAYALKQQQGGELLFVDIRTPSELVFVGIPENIDINIPFLTMDYKQWDEKKASFKKVPNKDFVESLNVVVDARRLTKKSEIILICRSGKRSARAADLLSSSGYLNVSTVVHGFEGDKVKEGDDKGKRMVNGWKKSGLPWTYKLKRNQVSTASP